VTPQDETSPHDGAATIGVAALAALIAERATGRRRFVVGVTGPPGSGKSTVAARLADDLGAVVVPMDGFHVDDDELRRSGLADVKGAPDTFDATGFVDLVRRLSEGTEAVSAPAFDRVADRTVPGAITVAPSDRLVVVEGNYLLLDRAPWSSLRASFDLVAYLVVDDDVRVARLIERHVRHGRSSEEASEFVHRSDEANAALVATTRARADVLVDTAR
jgi:pantothenate kinase